MKKTILTLALSLPCLLVFSQQDSLLKNFKFRNINYRAITINAGGSSQYMSRQLAIDKAKNSSSGGNLGVGYYTLKSTDRILFSLNAGLSTGFSESKSIFVTDESRNRAFSVNPSLEVNNKWFSKKYFAELGFTGSIGFSGIHEKEETPFSDSRNRYVLENLSTVIGVGTGRLENITNMQNALWLNRVLEKENELSRSLSPEELTGLAESITKANNTRILDYRKRIQYVLTTVDRYLQERGLVDTTDITYFSNLNDILFFAVNQQKLSGTEKFIRLKPGLTGYAVRNTRQPENTKSTENIINKSAELSIGFSKYVPSNLEHQNNFGASLQGFYLANDGKTKSSQADTVLFDINSNKNLRQAGVSAFYQHAIYPNTRTTINLYVDAKAGYQEVEKESTWYGLTTLTGSVVYFISYRTTLNGSLTARLNRNVYNIQRFLYVEPETIQLFANIGLQVNL